MNLVLRTFPVNSVLHRHTKAYLGFVDYILLPSSKVEAKTFERNKKLRKIYHFNFFHQTSLPGCIRVEHNEQQVSVHTRPSLSTLYICHATSHPTPVSNWVTFTPQKRKKNSCRGNLSKKNSCKRLCLKKIRVTEVTCIALKGNVKKNKLKEEYCNTQHFITTAAV